MLVDTSVWVDHFRQGDAALGALLIREEVECHPFIIGELACGSRKCYRCFKGCRMCLWAVPMRRLRSFERHRLLGRGIGWMDAHLLTSASLGRSLLWTPDRRLSEIARNIGSLWSALIPHSR